MSKKIVPPSPELQRALGGLLKGTKYAAAAERCEQIDDSPKPDLITGLIDAPETARALDQRTSGEDQEGYRTRQVEALVLVSSKMERERAKLVKAMRAIAKPALGGKAQQYAAQAALRDIGEKL